jgi:hypothetical protein
LEREANQTVAVQQIDKAVNELYKRAQDAAPPWFVLELQPVSPGTVLKGGEIRV